MESETIASMVVNLVATSGLRARILLRTGSISESGETALRITICNWLAKYGCCGSSM